MAQVLVNFRLDEEDKKRMEEVCSELGLSMSAAFTIFAKKMSRERRIPFEITADAPFPERDYYSPQTETQLLSRIDRALQQIKDRHYSDAIEAGARIRNEFDL